MPRLLSSIASILIATLCITTLSADTGPTIQSRDRMPLAFTKNTGQWDDRVLYRTTSGGATIWITKEGITYQYTRRVGNNNTPLNPLSRGDSLLSSGTSTSDPIPLLIGDSLSSSGTVSSDHIPLLRGVRGVSSRDSLEQLVNTARFADANPNPEIIADGQLEYKCNYFLGNDPAKWHTNVPNYETVTLKDLYPGIDLKLSSDANNQATYEFISAPGADISKIRVTYEGAEGTSVDANGRTILKTKWGNVVAAMGSTDRAGLVSPLFVANPEMTPAIAGENQSLSETKSGTLELAYSTCLGGGSDDWGSSIVVDDGGSAYVMGETESTDFPTVNPYETYQGDRNIFIAKLNSEGKALIYSTYLGGSDYEGGGNVALDVKGSVYVTGYTYSVDFPTERPFQANQGSPGWSDVFVTKLSSSGDSLVFSTYLGGTNYEYGYGIAVDGNGNAYVTGATSSSDFPTFNPLQPHPGSFDFSDAFVTEFSSSGSTLMFSTYLGGAVGECGYDIAVDGVGCAYVTGCTLSRNFPTLNAVQSTYSGLCDAFVTKIASSGYSLAFSTYLGGGDYEEGTGILVDDSGCVFVRGWTKSVDFPTWNAYDSAYNGSGDVFVTKLSPHGDHLLFGTYLGGIGDDNGFGIAVDDSGNVYLTGGTSSPNFPTLRPYQPGNQGGYADAFVAKLSDDGANLLYGSYFGGDGHDCAGVATVDDKGSLYFAGSTNSMNFPTANSIQPFCGGAYDAFITKFLWVPTFACGDTDGDESITIADVVFLVYYIFVGGPAPDPLSIGDTDCNGSINIADAVVLINYIFSSGPAPCSDCS